MKLKAAIIGLGQIASRYQEDPKRKGIVTHAAAYQAHPNTCLVAGYDPHNHQRKLFVKRWKNVRAYSSLDEMLLVEKPDIVSVCSPAETHAPLLKKLLVEKELSFIKGIWCEKPLALSLKEVSFLKSLRRKIPVSLNFSRRWDSACQKFAQDVSNKKWGEIQNIDIYYTGSFADNATHALDLIHWFFGERSKKISIVFHQLERSNYLIFEIDFYFTKARHRLVDSGFEWQSWKRVPHKHFSGFHGLKEIDTPYKGGMKNLLRKSLDDLVTTVKSGGQPRCTLKDGLNVLSSMEGL